MNAAVPARPDRHVHLEGLPGARDAILVDDAGCDCPDCQESRAIPLDEIEYAYEALLDVCQYGRALINRTGSRRLSIVQSPHREAVVWTVVAEGGLLERPFAATVVAPWTEGEAPLHSLVWIEGSESESSLL